MTPEAFLSDIRENPDDDAPRLVYADWLDENGDPERAEFIRAQVRLVRLPEDSEERWELEDRADVLLARHGQVWLASLPAGFSASECGPVFWRGFLEVVHCAAVDFAQGATSLAEPCTTLNLRHPDDDAFREAINLALSSPVIARFPHLDIGSRQLRPDLVAALADSPTLAHVRSLDLGSNVIGAAGLATISASPNFRSLESLRLSFGGVGQEGVAALCASPLIERLRRLSLSHEQDVTPLLRCSRLGRMRELLMCRCNLSAGEAARFCANTSLSGLERLHLPGNPIGPEGIEALASWDGLRGLCSLSLNDTRATPVSVLNLGNSIWLRQLRELSLDLNSNDFDPGLQLGPVGARAIADCLGLSSLEELSLARQGIGDEGAVALSRWTGLAALRYLGLHDNGISDRGLAALAASPHVARLEDLCFGRNQAGDAGAEAVAESMHLGRLRKLRLGLNGIGARGAQALASGRVFPWLRLLDLGSCVIGDEGAAALAGSPCFPRLRELRLNGCGISGDGGRALLEAPWLEGLTTLHLFDNPLSDLREAFRVRFGEVVRI